MHDLVIRNGTVIDGSGQQRKTADIAVDDGRISLVGDVSARGREEVDARDRLVTPGFVDIHTHYDAQVTWDAELSPTSWHGVTSVVMGNCGVGFAPARPDKHDDLIGLMEGVEDIPEAAMSEGIQWEWESFPEYIDALAKKKLAIDVATQVPHGPLRAYVMGERGEKHEEATADDLGAMAKIVEDGIRAGALGFSTSRTFIHKANSGEYVPGTFAAEDELLALAESMKRGGGGVLQMTSNHEDMLKELEWMVRVAKKTEQTISFNMLQTDKAPELWRQCLEVADAAFAQGANVVPQIAGRPQGILMGWQCTANPFLTNPTFCQVMHEPWEERLRTFRDPEFKRKLLDTKPLDFGEFETFVTQTFSKMFRLDPKTPNYEPDPIQSAEAIAKREGRQPAEVAYDWLCENDGEGIVYFPIFNYSHENLDHLHTLLQHPRTALGLGDGGAHCGAICDASLPTFMLSFWARDRSRGDRLGLEAMVKKQTRSTAEVFGLNDRGLLKPGYRADLNVINFDELALEGPRLVWDLPAGGRRLVQGARGYDATFVAGQAIRRMGESTGARPGRLVKGRQSDAV